MIYKSIAERLRIRLNSADFTLNSLLPGEKKLAEEFAVSRMTIRKAIDLLVAWGLVVRRHGSGTYLVRKDVLHQTASLTGLVEVLKRQGKMVTSQVLIFEIMPAPPAIASQLRIQINEQIYFSRRVRFVEGKPLMLEDSYMPVKLFRNLSLQHLEGSKFEYIEQECGILIGGNYESLTPVLADRLLARQMKVAEHTPLLRITSLSYSESGEFLNYSVMFRNANEYQVEYHLRRLHPEKS
ncbi:TPA: GntR family transcriptional regulator [Escherichia coli]|nr:GntR family transcriptional regulator [Escherichia coli]HCP1508805.1 GntR family transcriptional regulator [Escherichia coli]HCP1665508.1 GntR family transcriptional regulator [Escherichia coli]HCP1806987.1 GntR family transcriptional regulator [Escherichia coli]